MSPPRVLVASDAHLGAVPRPAEARFLDFLEHVPEMAGELLLAGDTFDFWFEYRSAVLREHFHALRLLARLVDAGVRVRWIGGNHDAWAGSFLEEDVGLELLDAPVVTEVAGHRTFLAHGDGMGSGDWGYRLLKRVVRSAPARGLFHLLHPDLSVPLVRRISHTGAEVRSGGLSRKEGRAERLSNHAASLLSEDPELDLVIFGHAHRPELREVRTGGRYLNPGDWIRSFTYGVVEADGVSLRRWEQR